MLNIIKYSIETYNVNHYFSLNTPKKCNDFNDLRGPKTVDNIAMYVTVVTVIKGAVMKKVKESLDKLFETTVKIYDNDEEEVKRLKLLDIVKASKNISVIKQSTLHYTVTIRML